MINVLLSYFHVPRFYNDCTSCRGILQNSHNFFHDQGVFFLGLSLSEKKRYEDEVKLFVYGHEILGKWNFRYVLSISVSTKIQVRAKFPSAHHKFTINEFPWNNEFPVRSACLRPEQYFFHVL